jgi:hypothetical protein
LKIARVTESWRGIDSPLCDSTAVGLSPLEQAGVRMHSLSRKGGQVERRRVRCVTRDNQGDITAIGNASEAWRRRSLNDAIADIEQGRCSYYVEEQYPAVNVNVRQGTNRKYLQTTADRLDPNNLDRLTPC